MKITLFSLIFVSFYFASSLASPFESNHNEDSMIYSKKNQWIEDRFNRLERELALFKEKNVQQEKEIDHLKAKVFQLESNRPIKEKKTEEEIPVKQDYNSFPWGVPKAPIPGPSSCQDIENTNPGLGVNNYYIVRNVVARRMKLVYCSFDGPVVETFVGNLDMKTVDVHFDYQRTTSYFTPNSLIPFDYEQLNIGGGMNGNRGLFTAPVDGTYHFSFSGVKDSSVTPLSIEMELNGFLKIGESYAPSLNYQLGVSVIHTSLKLTAGDTISLKLVSGTLYDTAVGHFTHFEGWLQGEDLVFA